MSGFRKFWGDAASLGEETWNAATAEERERCADLALQHGCTCFCLEDSDEEFRGRIATGDEDGVEIREVVKHDPRCPIAIADEIRP